MAFGMSAAFAQEGLTSKKGEPYLPESGDWALGIDAAPVLNYFGAFLSNAGAAAPTWGYSTGNQPLTITGKYFTDAKTAYRAMVRIGFGSTKTTGYNNDDTYTGTSINKPQVTDTKKASYNNITLGAGLEMRRGKTRLQGYYGGMLMFGFGGSSNTYTYGNAITKTDNTPTRTDYGDGNNIGGGEWATTKKMGSTFMLALRGFIGAEYFIFPKIAVGAEFGWGLGLKSTGDGQTDSEAWDPAGSTVATKNKKTGGTSTFGLDTDINSSMMMPTGMLTLNLHF